MSAVAISVRNLDKVFRIWARPSDMLWEGLTGKRRHTEFHALRDISFDVAKGEVLGVMGRNGAGKSTLLRVIAGTLNATGGSVVVDGRVAAILELGTGFHPEYTGRDNIFLGGLCLGLTHAEITKKVDEIIDFAELRQFIDQPFRTYSSGMQARLTFSVATAVDPDVLIIDEALAVGDARFSLKSFDRVREFRSKGKAILLVSHDINQINAICDRAILLDGGRVSAEGDPVIVGKIYHELLFGQNMSQDNLAPELQPISMEATTPANAPEEPAEPSSHTHTVVEPFEEQPIVEPLAVSVSEHRYGDRKATIKFHLEDEAGRRAVVLQSGGHYRIVSVVTASEALRDLCIGVTVRTPRGIEVFGADSSIAVSPIVFDIAANNSARIVARFKNHLAPGVYFLTAGVARTDGHKHDMRFDALEFVVEPAPGVYHASLVNLDIEFAAPIESSQQRGAIAADA